MAKGVGMGVVCVHAPIHPPQKHISKAFPSSSGFLVQVIQLVGKTHPTPPQNKLTLRQI